MFTGKLRWAALAAVTLAVAAAPASASSLVQQGTKLTGTAASGVSQFGSGVALSADGGRAVVGGAADASGTGAAWIFTRSATGWIQQGAKLTGAGEVGQGHFGADVAISADGNTVAVGGYGDNSSVGAVWVYTRSGNIWSLQGTKLTPTDETGSGQFGGALALSADGNTLLVGGSTDNAQAGAAWVFTRSGSTWTQQGAKLTGAGEIGAGRFGSAVALSADGGHALIGGAGDNASAGAAWAYTRSGSTWTQQGPKLSAAGSSLFGGALALSADATTAVIGGSGTGSGAGSAWVFARSGSGWTQQGGALTPSGETGAGQFGISIAVTGDGNTALIGAFTDDGNIGAAWAFRRTGATWAQLGAKLTSDDEVGNGLFGGSVSLSADGATALIGMPTDNASTGAASTFTLASPQASTPSTLDFGSQTVAQPGPVMWLDVQNTGTGPLTFSGAASVSPSGEFAIPAGDDLCQGHSLAPGQVCWIGVRFTPVATGGRSATLTLGASDSTVAPAAVALTGTGVAFAGGVAGAPGATGPAGPAGRDGQLALVAYEARASSRSVLLRYVLTQPADITVAVVGPGARAARVVEHLHGQAGRNSVRWNRKLGRRRARAGRYRIVVSATVGGRTASSWIAVRLS